MVIKTGYFDTLKEKTVKSTTVSFKPEINLKGLPTEGYIWVNILVKYDLSGKAEVVRAFSKPAIESRIKHIIKPKKHFVPKMERKEATEKKNLF